MGNQQTVQSSSVLQQANSSQAMKPKPSSFDPQHPRGDATTENTDKGPCAEASGAGCYLSKDQRAAVVSKYRAYVGLVATQCTNAITELKIQEQIKSTDEIPWYVNLIMSAIAAVLTDGLSMGIAAGTAAGRAALGGARAVTAAAPELAAEVQKMFAVVALEAPTAAASTAPKTVAGKIIDAGNAALKPTAAETVSIGSPEAKQKQENLGFLDYLNKSMMIAFKRLIDEPPSKLDDADLIALRDNLDPTLDRNLAPAFVAKFSTALDEFKSSPVSKIGRRNAWDEKRGNERYELETRVAWLIAKGSGRRLIYVDRAFSGWYQRQQERGSSSADMSRSRAYDSGHNQLSLQQDATWQGPLGNTTDHETPIGPDMMIKYVEPDFAELALQKQHDVWLAEPETFMLDYSYAPPKMVKVASS